MDDATKAFEAALLTRGADVAEELYDKWAETYDDSLTAWNYQAPRRVAELCVRHGMPADGPILDAGCGTGISGEALRQAGIRNPIYGSDISTKSLDLIGERKPGLYAAFEQVDLDTPPLPYGDGALAGVICVGVLSYVNGIEGAFREFVRCTRPGGLIVWTHREDYCVAEGDECLSGKQKLEREGLWAELYVSGPESYLPDAPVEAERSLRIRSFVMRRC